MKCLTTENHGRWHCCTLHIQLRGDPKCTVCVMDFFIFEMVYHDCSVNTVTVTVPPVTRYEEKQRHPAPTRARALEEWLIASASASRGKRQGSRYAQGGTKTGETSARPYSVVLTSQIRHACSNNGSDNRVGTLGVVPTWGSLQLRPRRFFTGVDVRSPAPRWCQESESWPPRSRSRPTLTRTWSPSQTQSL